MAFSRANCALKENACTAGYFAILTLPQLLKWITKTDLFTFIILFKTHLTSSRTSYCSTSPLSLAARLYNETERDNNSKIDKLLAKHQMFKCLKIPSTENTE